MSQITTLTHHRSPQNQPHYFIRTHHLNKRQLCWSHQNKGSINQGCHKRFYRHMFFWFIFTLPFETSATASCGYMLSFHDVCFACSSYIGTKSRISLILPSNPPPHQGIGCSSQCHPHSLQNAPSKDLHQPAPRSREAAGSWKHSPLQRDAWSAERGVSGTSQPAAVDLSL